jgi:transposase InsO family protein
MEERARFVVEYESGEWTMTELCDFYGISRKTGYKILSRWREAGGVGLADQSRAPERHPNQTPEKVEEQILALRRAHMSWGPRKLRGKLVERHPERNWPAPSTIGVLLKRSGLVPGQRPSRRTPLYSQPFASATQPNDVWCVDFKGWFRTRDGARIDPFTMTDAHSRYLLRCQTVSKTDTAQVSAICQATFREFGLPRAIRSDNGAPFASRAVAGLSRLAVDWMKLGIVHERIKPGHPEQNGRHERMHRTLKQETTKPPAANPRYQQKVFDRFRDEYNQERPHEALGQKTPGSFYSASPRRCPARMPEPEYDSSLTVRSIYPHGQFFWKGNNVFLSKVLAGEKIGLEQLDDRYWCILFSTFPIAYFDSHLGTVGSLPTETSQEYGNPEISKNEIPGFPHSSTTTKDQQI